MTPDREAKMIENAAWQVCPLVKPILDAAWRPADQDVEKHPCLECQVINTPDGQGTPMCFVVAQDIAKAVIAAARPYLLMRFLTDLKATISETGLPSVTRYIELWEAELAKRTPESLLHRNPAPNASENRTPSPSVTVYTKPYDGDHHD